MDIFRLIRRKVPRPSQQDREKTTKSQAVSVTSIELHPLLPQTQDEVPKYYAAFEQAIRFTQSLGFEVADVAWLDRDALPKDGQSVNSILYAAGVRDMKGAAVQCLKWSHYLTPFFERHVGCTAWLTIGQIWKDNEPIFGPNWAHIERWSKEGIQVADFSGKKGFNLHAWITLQTGEIVDPTYFSSLAAFKPEFGDAAGRVTWGRDPAAIRLHRYYPMAVGSAYAEAVASRSVVPLLASNAADLSIRPRMAIV